ncbi:hypothetical protein AC578_7335 [Pseudocercospora eumusae]|uniref:Protein kinase domain-containing protein n=1 Tax=Pseudocercospora eumusae TaxID=321146 RepID=A0A139HX20_9PEZI|nr:hypothetical protein AC578_7335 [Pseudocercospora eumusae]
MLNPDAEAKAEAKAEATTTTTSRPDLIAQFAARYAGDTQSFTSSAAVAVAANANANAAQQHHQPAHFQANDASTSSTLLNVFTLTPANLPALESMCRLSEAATRQPPAQSYLHARQFIQPDPPQTLASALGLRDTSPLSVHGSFANDDSTSPPAQPHNAIVNSCSWLVSLAHVIRDPKLGWVLGRDVEKADLLLKPRGKTMVRSVHAVFRYNQSGQLQLYALRSGVTLDGTTLAPEHALTLHAERHIIGIADMTFTFHSARRHHEDAAFRERLQHWADQLSLNIHPHKYLCATPQHEEDILAGRYRVAAVAGVGGFHSVHDGRTTIFAAADIETGTAVAIKTCKRFDSESTKSVADEAAIYSNITSAMPASPSVADFIIRLHDVVPPLRPRDFNERDTIHFVFSPLADSDLHSHHFGAQGHQSVAIAQCLLALQWLHSIHWIHRDIKPGNIGVQSNPFRIVLLDLAQAVNTRTSPDACTPRPGSCGTIGYLAPELENAVFCPSPAVPRYNAKVDIFALGVIAFDLLCQPPFNHQQQQLKWVRNPNPFMDEHGRECQKFKSAIQQLRKSEQDSKEFLISQMLEPDPTARLDVDGALRHPFLEPVVREQRMKLVEAKEAQTRPGEKRQRNET